jgi:hypothetical protein
MDQGRVREFLADPWTPVWYGRIAAGITRPLEEEPDFGKALHYDGAAMQRKLGIFLKLPDGSPAPGTILVLDEFQDYFSELPMAGNFFTELRDFLESTMPIALIATGSSSVLPQLIRRTRDDLELVSHAGGDKAACSSRLKSLNDTKLSSAGSLGPIAPGRALAVANVLAQGSAGKEFRKRLKLVLTKEDFERVCSEPPQTLWNDELESMVHAAGGNVRALLKLLQDGDGRGKPVDDAEASSTPTSPTDPQHVTDAIVARAIAERHAAFAREPAGTRGDLDTLCKAVGIWALDALKREGIRDKSPSELGKAIRQLCSQGKDLPLSTLFLSTADSHKAWNRAEETPLLGDADADAMDQLAENLVRDHHTQVAWSGRLRRWDDLGLLASGPGCSISFDDSLFVHACVVRFVQGKLSLRQVQAMLDATSAYSTDPMESIIGHTAIQPGMVDAARSLAIRAGSDFDEEAAGQLQAVLNTLEKQLGSLPLRSASVGSHSSNAPPRTGAIPDEMPTFRLWNNQKTKTKKVHIVAPTPESLPLGVPVKVVVDASKVDVLLAAFLRHAAELGLPGFGDAGATEKVQVTFHVQSKTILASTEEHLKAAECSDDIKVMTEMATTPQPVANREAEEMSGLEAIASSNSALGDCDGHILINIYASQKEAYPAGSKAKKIQPLQLRMMPMAGDAARSVAVFDVVLDGVALGELYDAEISKTAQLLQLRQFHYDKTQTSGTSS